MLWSNLASLWNQELSEVGVLAFATVAQKWCIEIQVSGLSTFDKNECGIYINEFAVAS